MKLTSANQQNNSINNLDIITHENEKGTCMLIDAAVQETIM